MNILLITTDQHAFNALGCSGNSIIKTPNIDRLASEGTAFTRHTCSSPVCTPARVSILNGRYARSHGAFFVGYNFDRNENTLPHWLAQAGYRCAMAGKTHFEAEQNGNAEKLPEGSPYYGFHESYLTEDIQNGPYIDYVKANYPDWYDEVRRNNHEDYTDTWGTENGCIKAAYKSKLIDEVHPSRWITDRSIDFVRRQAAKGEKFFLWTSFVDPHHPWNPIEPFASMYNPDDLPDPVLETGAHGGHNCLYNDGQNVSVAELKRVQALYYGMITHLDMHVGRLLDTLEQAGVLEDTVIIFTADHGDHDCQHRMIRKFGGLYDNIVRTPMLVRAPGLARAGATTSQLSQHEDIAPTVMDIAGLPIPETVQGVSLLPALRDGSPTGRSHSVYEEGPMIGIEGQRYKCVSYENGKRFVLTDLQTDPMEMTDLARQPAHKPVLDELRLELCNWLLRTPHWRPPRPFVF